MMLKLPYIILFSLVWVQSMGQGKEFWFPETTKDHKIARFAGQDSEDNLWLISSRNTLLRRTPGGMITEYEIPSHENSILNAFVSRKGIIYLSSIDLGYRTTFYRGHPQTGWNQFEGTLPNAIRQFMETGDGEIYAYGDWGSLIKLSTSSNSYKKMPFSYLEHITAASEAAGKLYLGVRSTGVVEYTSESSIILSGSGKVSSDIMDINFKDKSEYPAFMTMRGRLYEWENGEYKSLSEAPIKRSTTRGTYNSKGIPFFSGPYGQVYSFENGSWNTRNLPVNNNIIDFFADTDCNLFVVDENGRLYSLRPSGQLFFTNYPRQEAMIGNSLNKSMNIQTVDINNDGMLDITVNSSGLNNRINIYIQYDTGYYREESALFFDDYPLDMEHIWFQDFSSDGKTDLIVMYNKESYFYIDTYLQFQSKFIPHQQISIHSDSAQDLKDFIISDVDGDEDEDLILAFYYADGRQKGAVIILENIGHGKFELRGDKNSEYRQWTQTIWAGDINMDGIHDLIAGTFWSSDVIISGDLKSTTQKLHYLPDSTNTTDLIAADITRDGTPELIRNSWEYGLQIFGVSSDFTFNLLQDFYGNRSESVRSFSLVDINSDGWIDILVNGVIENSPFSHFLINRRGKLELVYGAEVGFMEIVDEQFIPIDVDRDGDLDIIALREGENKIFENHQNPEKVLNLFHNYQSGSTKQWIVLQGDTVLWSHHNYISGIGNGNAEFILGLKSLDDIRIKAGDNSEFEYQLKQKDGINQLFVVPKTSTLARVSMFLSYIHAVFHIAAFYYYILTILSGTFILMLTYYIGTKKLEWEWKSLVTITLANSTLFWILLALSTNLGELWRYGIPLGGVVAGSSLPIFFSMQNRFFKALESAEDAKLRILDLMLRFTHGAWSNSVINRFKMLLLNVSDEKGNGIMAQLEERRRSFITIVLPELKEILTLMKKADYNKIQIEMLEDSITFFENTLVKDDQSLRQNAEKISKKLEDLRGVIKLVRNSTWSNYSCDMIEVVQQVTDLHRDSFKAEKIEIDRRTDGNKEAWVLIPATRMAEIIDNIIINAMTAMKGSPDRKLSFFIFHKAPKWMLEISDTGSGMHPDVMEKIFESGFSNHNSSGQGLYKSQETLKQFGGRISVLNSVIEEGTTFKIECLEGVAP